MNYYQEELLKKNHAINGGRSYQQCTLSLMDTIADPNVFFDEKGVCNYYYEYLDLEKKYLHDENKAQNLEILLGTIKENGKGKPYDCITGVSGGVDSTYLIYMIKKWGLRPLIVHFDNGWNSEVAVNNINQVIKYTGFDLYTLVVDWEEFRDIQLAYLKANVVDIEVPTDHAISGTLQKLAAKFKIRYILSGNNIATEATLPLSWYFNKNDYMNLLSIHRKFGNKKLKTYPLFGIKEQYYYGQFLNIKTINPLNFIKYDKVYAKMTISNELGWKDYGGKHYESIFTKFYQAHILPCKFNIDKRKAHLSNLIFSKQLTKEDALNEISLPLYQEKELEFDIEYVTKKLGISRVDFEKIMNDKRVQHEFYGIQPSIFELYPILKLIKPIYKLFK